MSLSGAFNSWDIEQYVLPKACNLIKKETLAQVFSCEFYKIFKNAFFTEQLWTTASYICDTLEDLRIVKLKTRKAIGSDITQVNIKIQNANYC